ncbi:MAG: hypothetical protein QXN55_01305 [Candidatus Nitrosotenuis sp.]
MKIRQLLQEERMGLFYFTFSFVHTTYEDSLRLKNHLQLEAEKLGAEVEFIGREEDEDDDSRVISDYGFIFTHHSGTLYPKKVGIVLNDLYVKYTSENVDAGQTITTPFMKLQLPVNFLVDFSDASSKFVNRFIDQYFVIIAGTNFHEIHKKIQHIDAIFINDDVKTSALGLMLIKDLVNVSGIKQTLQWRNIFIKHLKSDRDLLECKTDLIENGYSELAKL